MDSGPPQIAVSHYDRLAGLSKNHPQVGSYGALAFAATCAGYQEPLCRLVQGSKIYISAQCARRATDGG